MAAGLALACDGQSGIAIAWDAIACDPVCAFAGIAAAIGDRTSPTAINNPSMARSSLMDEPYPATSLRQIDARQVDWLFVL